MLRLSCVLWGISVIGFLRICGGILRKVGFRKARLRAGSDINNIRVSSLWLPLPRSFIYIPYFFHTRIFFAKFRKAFQCFRTFPPFVFFPQYFVGLYFRRFFVYSV